MLTLVRPGYEFLTVLHQYDTALFIKRCGRTCYQSEGVITKESAESFCKMLIKRGHESVLEHYSFTVKFIIDRGVSHELVRHRLAAYSQESTRYCNYAKMGVTFVIPPWITDLEPGPHILCPNVSVESSMWLSSLFVSAMAYERLIEEHNWTPQQARSVLPNALKTEVVSTFNLRMWRHVIARRTMTDCHPQMIEIMQPLKKELQELLPVFFGDL